MSEFKSTEELQYLLNALRDYMGPQFRNRMEDIEDLWFDFETIDVVKDDVIDPNGRGSTTQEECFKEPNELHLFEKIKKFVKEWAVPKSQELKGAQIFTKAQQFEELTMETIEYIEDEEMQRTMHKSMYLSNISEQQKDWQLNILSYACKIALSEFVITKYHQQCMKLGWSLVEFQDSCALLRELGHSNKKIYNTAVPRWIKRYVKWYQRNVYKPLPHSKEHWNKPTINRDINVDFEYLKQINDAVYDRKCFGNLSPFQLDVYFVPFSKKSHELITKFCDAKNNQVRKCNKDSFIDNSVCYGAHRLLRTSRHELNLTFGERIKLVIERKDPLKSDEDTVYLWRAQDSNNVTRPMARYSEIPWIDNTKADIVPGLNPEKHGILTVSHHLHSDQCERVYLSFEDHGSRVFKDDMIKEMNILFKDGYNKISPENQEEFKTSSSDFRDPNYDKYGEYFFGPMTYNCFEAGWNDENPRANFNLFIEPDTTQKLKECINEHKAFANNCELYYNLDYTFAMQYQDGGMICIELSNNSLVLLIDSGLHRNNEKLFAVAVKNDYTSRQRWKMRVNGCGGGIGSCFMTKSELCAEFSIHEMDIPKGKNIKMSGNDDGPQQHPQPLESCREKPMTMNNHVSYAYIQNGTTYYVQSGERWRWQ